MNFPTRIDHRQIRRPRQLADIEPEGAGGDEHPLQQRIVKGRRRRRGDHPQIQGNDAERHGEEGRKQQQVPPGDAAALPPMENHQRGRQRDHHVLGQHPSGEQHQSQGIAPAKFRRRGCQRRSARSAAKGRSPFQKRRPGPDAGEVKQPGKHILALNGPSDGFHMQGMHGEDRGDPPSARHRQTSQNPPKQKRVGGMQQHVHHMVADRIKSPEFVLQPKAGVGERPIVRFVRFVRHEPDAPQAIQVPQRRFPWDVLHVIPNEAAPQHGRQVAQGGHDDERKPGHRRPSRQAAFCLAFGCNRAC